MGTPSMSPNVTSMKMVSVEARRSSACCSNSYDVMPYRNSRTALPQARVATAASARLVLAGVARRHATIGPGGAPHRTSRHLPAIPHLPRTRGDAHDCGGGTGPAGLVRGRHHLERPPRPRDHALDAGRPAPPGGADHHALAGLHGGGDGHPPGQA